MDIVAITLKSLKSQEDYRLGIEGTQYLLALSWNQKVLVATLDCINLGTRDKVCAVVG